MKRVRRASVLLALAGVAILVSLAWWWSRDAAPPPTLWVGFVVAGPGESPPVATPLGDEPQVRAAPEGVPVVLSEGRFVFLPPHDQHGYPTLAVVDRTLRSRIADIVLEIKSDKISSVELELASRWWSAVPNDVVQTESASWVRYVEVRRD